jgi:hypothetical protein
MLLELKNTHSKLHIIINDIFKYLNLKFMIVYIDDVLLFLKSITQHFNNLQKFLNITESKHHTYKLFLISSNTLIRSIPNCTFNNIIVDAKDFYENKIS